MFVVVEGERGGEPLTFKAAFKATLLTCRWAGGQGWFQLAVAFG